jgi:hypothetical protein
LIQERPSPLCSEARATSPEATVFCPAPKPAVGRMNLGKPCAQLHEKF